MNDDVKQMIESLKKSKSEEDRKRCIPLLQDYLRGNPTDAEAWFDLACCFDFIGAEVEAEPCYRKTFELGYQKISAEHQGSFFVGYGSTLRNNLKFDESADVLRKSVEAFPNYPSLDVFLAFSLYSQGKFQECAQVLFGAVTKIEGKPFQGYERAIKWYADNLETFPKMPETAKA